MKRKKFLKSLSFCFALLGLVAFIGSCDSSSSTQNTAGLLGAASIGFLEGTLLDNLEKSVNVYNYDLGKLNSGEPIIVAAPSVSKLTSSQREALLKWADDHNPVILMHPNESQLRAFQEIFGTDRTGGWAHVGNGDNHLEAYSLSLGADGSTYVGTFHPHVGPNDDEVTQDERADKLIDWVYSDVPLRRAEKETLSSAQDETVRPMGVTTSLPSVVHNASNSYQITGQGIGGDTDWGGNTSVNVVLNMYPVFDDKDETFWLAVTMEPELPGQDFSSFASYTGNERPALPNMYTFSSTLSGGTMDQNVPATTPESETFTNGFSWNIGFSGTAKGGASVKAGATWSNTTSKTISSVAVENQGSGGNQEVQFVLNGCQTSAQLSTFTTGPSTLWYVQNQSEGNDITFTFSLQVQFFPLGGIDSETPDPNLDNSCQTANCNVIDGLPPCTATATPLQHNYSIEVPKKSFL